jgi:capsular polysaccharide biosynthesis protein
MQIKDYMNVVRKRWWVVVLVALSAAAAAYGFSKLQTPLYRSQAIYQVLFNRLDTGSNMFADKLLNSYVGLVYQPDQMQATSDMLGLDQSGEALMEYVRVQAQPDTLRIVIEADHFTPSDSRRVVDAVGSVLNARVVEANRNLAGEDRAFLQLAQSARDGYLAKPQTRINVLAGGLLGLVLGLLLVFILEYMDDTLKTSSDVERFAGLATIGSIPSSSSTAGKRQARAAAASGIVAGSNRESGSRSERQRID